MLRLLKSENKLEFIEQRKKMKREDYVVWRRKERLVMGCILGALSSELVLACDRFDTARDIWLKLEQMYARSKWAPPPRPPPPPPKSVLPPPPAMPSLPPRKVLKEDDMEQATFPSYGTLLHLEVGRGDLDVVETLVQEFTYKRLKVKDRHGNSALHIAALTGNTAAARILVDKVPALLNQPTTRGGRLPIHDAARSSHKDTLEFFIEHITDDFNSSKGVLLLCDVIDAGFYDLALSLVTKYPDLARMKHDESRKSALERLSRKELAFRSGARFNFWEQLIYSFGDVQLEEETGASPQTSDIETALGHVEWWKWYKIQVQKLQFNLLVAIDKLVPQRRRILPKILMHSQAVELLACLCYNLSKEDKEAIYNNVMMTAARIGIPEVVEVIAETFPDTVDKFFQIAATNRCEQVFNLIYQTKDHKHIYSNLKDSSGNNVLHLVAKLAPPHKLNLVSGATLQMQRELQWFKEVENFVHPYAREEENNDGKTPKMVFSKEHKKLKEDGEKWMKDTANSYIIVAALIITVVFAAAITVPGGNDSNSGYPMLYKKEAFIVFAVSDVGSLFTSITSLLMFLSIMTSRYAEEDFMYALPKRLCFGLLTLFISIILLMVAFCASTYVMLGREHKSVLILVAAFASLPVACFVFLQFPLLMAVVSSTYGRGIFGKRVRYSPLF
ncbi:hypothetical protein ACS0TY_000750 [Phlomoides rotata]